MTLSSRVRSLQSFDYYFFFLSKVYLDGTVMPGEDLPGPISEHCMVLYKEKPYIFGGNTGVGKTSMVLTQKNGSKEWEHLPAMNFPRSNHSCGFMYSKSHGGRPIFVVAGGTKENNEATEILDFTLPDPSWQLGEF